MVSSRSSVLVALILSGLAIPARALSDPPQRDSIRVMRVSPGDGFILPETGAFIGKEGEDLKVRFAPPEGARQGPYRAVDIREGDLVLLANGKRVKTVEALSKAHAAAAVGSTFTLGLQRGKEMLVISFPKADPRTLPARRIIRRSAP